MQLKYSNKLSKLRKPMIPFTLKYSSIWRLRWKTESRGKDQWMTLIMQFQGRNKRSGQPPSITATVLCISLIGEPFWEGDTIDDLTRAVEVTEQAVESIQIVLCISSILEMHSVDLKGQGQ